jgi:preprotein translocase subunit YajC
MDAPELLALIARDPQTESMPAEEATSPFGNMLVPILVVMVLFYVIMLGPERKQRKKREAMLAALKKGDKVMLNSGMYGTVAVPGEDVVTIQVADGVRIRFARSAVQNVLESDDENGAKDKKDPIEKAKA